MSIELSKYTKAPKEFTILGLAVHAKPLKLRWKILYQPLNMRLTTFTREEAGLTDAEMADPQYGGLMKIYEHLFFAKSHDPNIELEKLKTEELTKLEGDDLSKELTPDEREKKLRAIAAAYRHVPTGPENLAELLSALVAEDVDWNKFIEEHPDSYDEIKKGALAIYEDFFTEILELKKM